MFHNRVHVKTVQLPDDSTVSVCRIRMPYPYDNWITIEYVKPYACERHFTTLKILRINNEDQRVFSA